MRLFFLAFAVMAAFAAPASAHYKDWANPANWQTIGRQIAGHVAGPGGFRDAQGIARAEGGFQ